MFGPWTLSYEGTEYAFGTPDHAVEVIDWEQAPDVYDVDDADLPRADGVAFGQDYVRPGDLSISVKIDFTDAPYPVDECVELAMRARGELARAWRADTVRSQVGAIADLTIGGALVVEGRPRSAKFDDTHQSVGLIYAELTFVQESIGAYLAGAGGGWQEVVLPLRAASHGGLKTPLVAPLRTSVTSSRATTFSVGGDSPTWGVYRLQGPLQSDVQFESPGRWRIYLNRALAWSDVATIDTRPGRRGTYLNGQPVQLLDPRSSLLDACTLLPGENVCALRGVSIEGTAQAVVRWRDRKGGY